jgi:hypothetical protein
MFSRDFNAFFSSASYIIVVATTSRTPANGMDAESTPSIGNGRTFLIRFTDLYFITNM